MVAIVVAAWTAVVTAPAPGGSGLKWTISAADPNDDVTVVRLTGTPYEMGWWYGNLLATEIRTNLDTGYAWAEELAEEAAPPGQDARQWLYDAIDQQIWPGMKPSIPQAFLDEMQGIVDGAAEAEPGVTPAISLADLQRYHAIVELAEFNCTAIGAVGPATHDGRLIQIRVLDFAMDSGCQDNPVIAVYLPDEGPAYCNVGFAGLIGSVAGMSGEGIAACEVGLSTPGADITNPSTYGLLQGIPMTLLMKKILAQSAAGQGKSALDRAVEIIQAGPRTSNYGYGVGDGVAGNSRSFVTTRSFVHSWGIGEEVSFNTPGDPNTIWMPDVPASLVLPGIPGVTYLPHDAELTVSLLDPSSPDYVGSIDPDVAVEVARTVAMNNTNLMDVIFDGRDLKLWVAYAHGANVDAADREFVAFDFGGPMPSPMMFAVEPNVVSAASVAMTATKATALGVEADRIEYAFIPDPNAQGAGNVSGWQTDPTYTDTGLRPNTNHVYRVKARNAASPTKDETAESVPATVCTLANRPIGPIVAHVSGPALTVTIDPNDGNPEWTEYALYDETRQTWLRPDGSARIGTTPEWHTRADWGTVTVRQFDADRIPAFRLKARNQDGIATELGPPQGTGESWSVGSHPDAITVVKLTGPVGFASGWHYGARIPRQIRENLDSAGQWGIRMLMARAGLSRAGVDDLLDRAWDRMAPFIPQAFIDELRGVAEGATAAGHAVTETEMRRSIVIAELSEFNCSAVGLTGSASHQARTLQTRNLDFDMGTGLQTHPVVTIYLPDNGPAYCNIGFASFMGVLAGVSAEQIAVSEAALPTPGVSFKNLSLLEGIPMSFLLRKILAEATADVSNTALDRAVQIIRQAPRTSNYAYLIADARAGDSRMFATTKGTCEVFGPGQDIKTNEPNLTEIAEVGVMPGIEDVTYIAPGGDFRQVHDLLSPNEPNYVGPVDPNGAIEVSKALAMGDGNLLNVVWDLNSLRMWVAVAEGSRPASSMRYVPVEDFAVQVTAHGEIAIRPNPMTFSRLPEATGPSTIVMKAAGPDAAVPSVQYFFIQEGGQPSGWRESRTYTADGLRPNTLYAFRVKARDPARPSQETVPSIAAEAYTFAAVPEPPALGGATATSLVVDVAAGDNPPETELAIYDTTRQTYIDADGEPTASPVWQTELAWGRVTVAGLTPDTEYALVCRARNADGVVAGDSPLARATTLADTEPDDDDGDDDDDDQDETSTIDFAKAPTSDKDDPTTAVTMSAPGTVEGLVTPIEYYFRATSVSGERGATSSGWIRTTAYTDRGLVPNAWYRYQLKARETRAGGIQTGYSAPADVCTQAAVPPAPEMLNPTADSLDISPSRGSNAQGTPLAIYNKTDRTYLDENGNASPTAVWQSQATWETVRAQGLDPDREYAFACKARNDEGIKTKLGEAAKMSTTASDVRPDLISVRIDGPETVAEWGEAKYTVKGTYRDHTGKPVEETLDPAGVSWRVTSKQWGVISEEGVFQAHEVHADMNVWIYADVDNRYLRTTCKFLITIVNKPDTTKPADDDTTRPVVDGQDTTGPGMLCPTASLTLFAILIGGILASRRRMGVQRASTIWKSYQAMGSGPE